MWELKNGLIPAGKDVLHHCDNPPCVRDDHLFLGTQKDNNQDCCRKGRNSRGERHYRAILTEQSVREIRSLKSAGVKARTIARRYSVAKTTIYSITERHNWKHVL
jgi:hypothetical protein